MLTPSTFLRSLVENVISPEIELCENFIIDFELNVTSSFCCNITVATEESSTERYITEISDLLFMYCDENYGFVPSECTQRLVDWDNIRVLVFTLNIPSEPFIKYLNYNKIKFGIDGLHNKMFHEYLDL